MVTFKYRARLTTGQEVEGLIEAFDELEATAKIRSQYDIVLDMKQVRSLEPPKLLSFLSADLGGAKLNAKAFTLMCSQFSTILRAGIPIARAVKLIGNKTTDKALKKILSKCSEDVEAGRSLSSSFAEHGGNIFPPTFVETLRAGEEAGDMAGSFESIYKHFDKQTKMSDKVRGAMTYPIFVLIIAVVVVMVLMVKVVPTFTAMFEELDAELPIMTQMLIAISMFFRNYWFVIAGIIALIAVGFILLKRSPKGRIFLAKTQLRLPVLGNIAQLNAASLFANTMATMIGSGLPVTKAVSITANVMTNEIIKEKVAGMVGRIEEGRSVVDSMRETEVMPDILTDMVGVGEETGELRDTLDTVAAYYDNELELAVSKAIAMLEPSMLIFLAVVAGFIVIAIYMSMFEMYSVM
ncbi:MAG: type II secretion system F family protein [Lachnospiraceae bacterium]|nr:type II secretion system F family protein [Lachnospiraceae bacterium]